MPQIDQDSRWVGAGVVYRDRDTTIPLHINDSTKELLIEIIPLSSPLSSIVPNHIANDENHDQIAGAVTNNASKTITPITVDEILELPCVRVEVS